MSDPDERPRPHDAEPLRPRPHDAEPLRPRPQYGEYATPEEQRARIRQPDTTRLLETGQDPDALQGAVPAGHPAVAVKPHVITPGSVPMSRGRLIDRIATIALLVYGLVNVISAVPRMFDYSSYATELIDVLGVDGQLADPTLGRPWGIAAGLVFAIGWLLTAYISWWSLSRGRVTWWIPLVAGIVFTFATVVLLMVPIVSDPTLWNAVLGAVR